MNRLREDNLSKSEFTQYKSVLCVGAEKQGFGFKRNWSVTLDGWLTLARFELIIRSPAAGAKIKLILMVQSQRLDFQKQQVPRDEDRGLVGFLEVFKETENISLLFLMSL